MELPRYSRGDPPDFPNELAAFLERSGLLTSILAGRSIDIQLFASRLRAESDRTACHVARLVVLDGLSIGDTAITFGDAALHRLEPANFESFFNEVTLSRPNLPDYLNGLVALHTVVSGNSPPWDSYSLPEPPTHSPTVVQDAAQPWLNYINLWSLGTVRPIALYEKNDSLLTYEAYRDRILEEPTFAPRFQTDERLGIPYSYVVSAPMATVEVSNSEAFVSFVADLHQRHLAAPPNGPRLEKALNSYARACAGFWQFAMFPEAHNVCEGIVIDSITALEAVFLRDADRRNKATHLSTRASALVGQSPAEQRSLRRMVSKAYDLRSAILHADQSYARSELPEVVRHLNLLLRKVLVAFIWLEGNQQRLIDGVSNSAIAAANAALVPSYRA